MSYWVLVQLTRASASCWTWGEVFIADLGFSSTEHYAVHPLGKLKLIQVESKKKHSQLPDLDELMLLAACST